MIKKNIFNSAALILSFIMFIISILNITKYEYGAFLISISILSFYFFIFFLLNILINTYIQIKDED